MRHLVAISLGLALASVAAPALADTKAGVDAWAKGEYEKAIKEWRPLAIKGDADAQFNLGQAYKMGRGIAPDLEQARQWYAKAAAQGHVQAEDNLGLVMFQTGNRAGAIPYIEKSANRGDPRAQYILGTAMFNGDLVAKDWPRAYALMTRASASGLPAASKAMAQMDQHIPVAERQQGLALARDMEAAAARPQIASAPAATPAPVARPVTPPIRQAELPPSTVPGATYDTRPVAAPPPPKAVAPAKPVAQPKPVAATPVSTTSGKGWRIQLGAFGDQSRARALWSSVEGQVSALSSLTPYLVQAGTVTRLQGGNLTSKAAAEKMCGQVRAAGNACLVVAP